MEILERVQATLRERQLLPPEGGTVIVGYSGGADSTALLHLLTRLQGAFNLRIHAAHLHHGMRPEADDDVRVCASVCAQLGVPLHVERVDVPALAQAERLSLEEAGRNARYAFFERLAHELNAVAVALAHTRDDQIETILINLLRGTGPRGLCGMPYKRDRIIRPLLDATREQTHQYCAAQGLPTVFDRTNLDPHQLRRRVRMELIPLLRDLSPAFDRHLLRLADILENEEAWWEYEVHSLMECGSVASADAEAKLQHSKIRREFFTRLHPAMQRRVLREWLRAHLGTLRLPPYEILEGIRRAALDGKRTSWQLSDTLRLTTDETALTLHAKPPAPEPYEYPVELETPILIPQAGAWLEARLLNAPPPSLETTPDCAYLDADAVQGQLIVRNARRGDRFQPLGMPAPKKLSDIFVDRKVPRAERGRLPLLCDAAGILWAPGYTIAARARITPHTTRALHVALRRNDAET
ncbi:MAG: tRNA lysidine(34) synthetase TilS [Armatimonadetes bacterium]|nr:tRNA lysidine(34) synthetase TilS [Armatimonadota bacterium]